MSWDYLVVGAGPTGLACAVELKRAGNAVLVVEKGLVAAAIRSFPRNMKFFSGPASLEIGGHPMPAEGERPTREEAVRYYAGVARANGLQIRGGEMVLRVLGSVEDFEVQTTRAIHHARRVVIATGYYGQPNFLGIPGEDLPNVSHYFADARAYSGRRVAVIGGRNSAGFAAAELAKAAARVTLIHRRARFGMKPWIAKEVEELIASEAIRVYRNAEVLAIAAECILLRTEEGVCSVANDYVLAMTGYRADLDFLAANQIPLSACGTRPLFDPDTLETGRPGVYLAGTVTTGIHTHEMSIENGRHHGAKLTRGQLSPA